ncbi:MAG TPA: hypothetical protein VGD38_19705 [Pyrinomonadaceae bacterium]
MNLLRLPLAYLLLISVVAVPVAGQQKRRVPEKTPAKTPAAPAPATPVTFDTLLSANMFKVYVEVRGVGQLIRSNAATEVLDPILKLGGPPDDFISTVNWLKTHSDQLMTSRMMVAAWPNVSEVPDVVIAIEFSSVDEATKFNTQLNGMLAKVLPPVPAPPSPPEKQTDQQKPATEKAPELVPSYYMQRADSLILISPKPLQLKKLKPKGSKLLAEEPNFRVAYNRFSSEPVFVYVDIAAIQKENEERTQKAIEQYKKDEEARKEAEQKQKAEAEQKIASGEELQLTEEEKAALATFEAKAEASPEVVTELAVKEPTEAEALGSALTGLQGMLFSIMPNIPDAVGVGFSPDSESFDVRLLMIDAPGESSDPIPFFSGLRLGEPVTPESPGVLPSDSDLVIMLALDFPEIYGLMSAFDSPQTYLANAGVVSTGTDKPVIVTQPAALAAPLQTIERITKINVKDELLPLLGSEIAVNMPLGNFNLLGLVIGGPQVQPQDNSKTPPKMPFVVISLRDREGMRRMMPRILEGFAGKAAAALAQTERREDTELVSIANMFAYAFVGNFLVLSPDAATTRHVVESYLKGETLSSDTAFRNYTRWQPRQVQAQAYLSPAFAESYKSWANSPSARISDEARALMTRVSTNPQPVSYSLSNDGLGSLHELHVPKSLVITAIASIASTENPPATVKNERSAMSVLWSISSAQRAYKEEKTGSYASLEELVSANLISTDMLEATGYKFEVRLVPDGFEISAVPAEYGKTGKLSFFMNNVTAMIRGADHGGGPASASDPHIGY